MAETHTVGSGKTYATWAAAESAQNGDMAGRGVVGFEGTGGDLGVVAVSGGSNIDSSNYIRLYPASGEEHDGKTTSDDGCYVDADDSTAFNISDEYVRVEGIRVQGSTSAEWSASTGVTCTADNVLIDGLVVVYTGAQTNGLYYGISVASASSTVQNVTVYDNTTNAGDATAITAVSSDGGTHSVTVLNCSVNGSFTTGFLFQQNSGTLNGVSTNNVAMNCGNDFLNLGSAANVTWTYGCSSDATADDEGGSGNLISKTDSNQWVSVGSDHNVKDDSADIYDSGTNSGAPGEDILGVSRPQATNSCIGAFELTAGGGTTKKRVVAAFAAFLSR